MKGFLSGLWKAFGWSVIAFVVFFLAAAFSVKSRLKEGYYPPHSTVAGATLGEWAKRWWLWLGEHGAEGENPINDYTGAAANVGKDHPYKDVWFLAGSSLSLPVHRFCEIPADRAIFLPIIVGAYENKPEIKEKWTCDQTRTACRASMKAARSLYFELDGKALRDQKDYYEESPGCFDASPEVTNIFVAGYWVMLKPLAPGEHLIRFGGVAQEDFKQDIEYRIRVK